MESTKMETASFNIFDKARWKFQLSDPDAYFVHHMSMFEHVNHKKYGFSVAQNKTLLLSKAAVYGECNKLKVRNDTSEYLAIVPFYGGLPPNITSDLSVKSIGQGNSLVDASTKALQCLATICSCLKYFGHVVIGVGRTEDRLLMMKMIHSLQSKEIIDHTNIIEFRLQKPAHLPFHLLVWGQHYIRKINCQNFISINATSPANHTLLEDTETSRKLPSLKENHVKVSSKTKSKHKHSKATLHNTIIEDDEIINQDLIPKNNELFEICLEFEPIKPSHGGPFNITYIQKVHGMNWQKNLSENMKNQRSQRHLEIFNESSQSHGHGHHRRSTYNITELEYYTEVMEQRTEWLKNATLRFVYYTECDQVVRFDDDLTLHVLSMASNESTFFTGRRKEKDRESDANDYMGGLKQWRECGTPGFHIHWPKDAYVHPDNP